MSKFKEFMKANKLVRASQKYVVTQALTDENGEALEWEIRPITTKENDFIREECLVASANNNLQFNHSLYLAKLVSSSVVYPNLNDAELQNSYGVMSAEDLLKEMVDCPAEYQALCDFVTSSGFESLQDRVETAKK